MMHRRGKSDLVIVAVKLANKVERSAAELKRFSPDLNLGIPKQLVMIET
jgi:hypothetical protein